MYTRHYEYSSTMVVQELKLAGEHKIEHSQELHCMHYERPTNSTLTCNVKDMLTIWNNFVRDQINISCQLANRCTYIPFWLIWMWRITISSVKNVPLDNYFSVHSTTCMYSLEGNTTCIWQLMWGGGTQYSEEISTVRMSLFPQHSDSVPLSTH